MRFLIIIILFCFIVSFTACHDKNALPNGILKREQMQAVLWDFIQADAFTSAYIKRDSANKPLFETIKLQKQIFALHHITREDFNTSYAYYKEHPAIMLTMLDSMTAKANRQRDLDLKNKIPIPKKILPAVADSIKYKPVSKRNLFNLKPHPYIHK